MNTINPNQKIVSKVANGKHNDTPDIANGAVVGIGVGVFFGIAAATLIPSVGYFITFDAALSITLGAAGGGAIVGITTGLIASALSQVGYSSNDLLGQ